MKINEISESSTTSGAIAVVNQPLNASPIKRTQVGKGVYGGKQKVGNLLTGKATSKPFANSVVAEGKMKDIATDTDELNPGNFQKKYNKTKDQMKNNFGNTTKSKDITRNPVVHEDMTNKFTVLINGQDSFGSGSAAFDNPEEAKAYASKMRRKLAHKHSGSRFGAPEVTIIKEKPRTSVQEDKLDEEDLIFAPGYDFKQKFGLITKDQDSRGHEVERTKDDLKKLATTAKEIFALVKDKTQEDGIPSWIRSKISNACDNVYKVKDYLDKKAATTEGSLGSELGGLAGEVLAPEFTPVSGAVGSALGSALQDKIMPPKQTTDEGTDTPGFSSELDKRITVKSLNNTPYGYAVFLDDSPIYKDLSTKEARLYKNKLMHILIARRSPALDESTTPVVDKSKVDQLWDKYSRNPTPLNRSAWHDANTALKKSNIKESRVSIERSMRNMKRKAT